MLPTYPLTLTIPAAPEHTVPPPVAVPPTEIGFTVVVFIAVVAAEHIPLVTTALTYNTVPLTLEAV